MFQKTLRMAFLVIALITVAYAQGITGTITGLVSDPSGARVVGANVTALNVDTGIRYSTASNDTGAYVLPLIPVGRYELTIENSGFKKLTRSDLQLGADQRLRVDAFLELGAVAEGVTISGEAPLVKTDVSSLGSSFVPSQLENLPIGRDALNMMKSIPGVQASKWGFSAGNINGSRDATSDYKVDGTPAATTSLNGVVAAPILELVEEVVVQTANYSAEFGRGSTQINLTTRAGTNQYHGTLFHYFQNNVLNANSFMNNMYGNTRPILRHNLFGGTIGGPVQLPRLYNGHNRTFFSFGYQGARQRGYGQRISSVPTEDMRQGDFAGQATIFDPATTRVLPGGAYARDPFAGNRIPTARLDPIALKMMGIAYPLPNRAGLANNFVRAGATSNTTNTTNERIDHNFNDKHRLTARHIWASSDAANFLRFDGPAGAGSNSERLHDHGPAHIVSTDYTYLIRPNLINDFRFGFNYQHIAGDGPGTYEGWPEKLGLTNVPGDKFPVVNITEFSPFGGSNLAIVTHARNFNFTESLVWVRGRHTIKTGFDYRRLAYNIARGSDVTFSFNTLPTRDVVSGRSGTGFAAFLLGIPANTNLSLLAPEGFQYRWSYYAAYLQDDFRLSSRVTLNLGLRWDTTTPRTELNNYQSAFNLRTLNLDFAGENGYPRTLYNTNLKNFQPRVGLAITPFGNNRTVIRAGYGLFYMLPNTTGDGGFAVGPWNRTQSWFSQDNGISFPLTLQNSVPAVSLSGPFVLSPMTGVPYIDRNYPDGYMQQWNFNIQRVLPGSTILEAGYTGSRGSHLQIESLQLNQVPAALLGPGNAQQTRPYPTRGGINAVYPPLGNSTYHALQLRAERRLASGVAFQVSYTLSKSIDNASAFFDWRAYGYTSIQDNYNLRAEKSVSGFDVTHNLAYDFVWQLPFGKGRKLLNSGGIANALFGGWNLSVMSTAMSGRPLIMRTLNNLTGSMGGGSRPNRLSDVPLQGEARGLQQWFNPAGFAEPAPYTFGNTSRTEPRLREPGVFSLDTMFAKEFSLSEKKRLQFRSELFNLMNHFNPGAPNTMIGYRAAGQITSGSGGRSIQLSLKLYY